MRRLISTLLIFLLLYASVLADENIAEITSNDYQIYGISIGDKYETVINKLGKPEREIVNSDPTADGLPVYVYYNGINFYINGNEVLNIEITKPGHSVKGIEIGDKLSKVYDTLGVNGIEQCEKECLRYNVRATNGVLTDAYLLLYIENDHVSKIIFWFNYT